MVLQSELRKLRSVLKCLAMTMARRTDYPNPIFVIEAIRKAGFRMKLALSNYRYGNKLLSWARDLVQAVENGTCNAIDIYRSYLLLLPATKEVEKQRKIVKDKVSLHSYLFNPNHMII